MLMNARIWIHLRHSLVPFSLVAIWTGACKMDWISVGWEVRNWLLFAAYDVNINWWMWFNVLTALLSEHCKADFAIKTPTMPSGVKLLTIIASIASNYEKQRRFQWLFERRNGRGGPSDTNVLCIFHECIFQTWRSAFFQDNKITFFRVHFPHA